MNLTSMGNETGECLKIFLVKVIKTMIFRAFNLVYKTVKPA